MIPTVASPSFLELSAGAGVINGASGSNRITLGSVYLNDLHALKRLNVANTSTKLLRIQFRTVLDTQVAFQLSNENLPDDGPDEAQGSSAGRPFNQLFNEVGNVSWVDLEPLERRAVILTFLPQDALGKRQRRPADGADEIEGSFEFSDVVGLLSFDVFCRDQDAQLDGASIQTIDVKFKARVCRSLLWSEVLENGIQFEECVIENTYFKGIHPQTNFIHVRL
jgi:hypothetical protein